MAKHVLKAGSHATWYVDTSGDKWIVRKNIDFQVYNGDGISDTAAQHNSRFEIAGRITALDGEGLDLYGRNDTVVIAASGSIRTAHGSGIAFEATAYNGRLENHGTITSESSGVIMTGASPVSGHQSTAEIVNFGRIAAELQHGIQSNSDDLRIVNKHGAAVIAGEYGYGIGSVANDVTVVNAGTIKGGNLGAINLMDGDDSVTNSGRIVGDVLLNNGRDIFISKGGSVTGMIDGGVGADTYVVDNKALNLHENGFSPLDIDLVKSSVTWTLGENFEKLVLTGTSRINGTGTDLANIIVGNARTNVLTGLGGDDMLRGGAGADRFVFATGSGHDTIADFKHGADRLDLRHYAGIDDFHDIVGIADHGKDTVVTLSDADTITLKNVSADVIGSHDFIFAG